MNRRSPRLNITAWHEEHLNTFQFILVITVVSWKRYKKRQKRADNINSRPPPVFFSSSSFPCCETRNYIPLSFSNFWFPSRHHTGAYKFQRILQPWYPYTLSFLAPRTSHHHKINREFHCDHGKKHRTALFLAVEQETDTIRLLAHCQKFSIGG